MRYRLWVEDYFKELLLCFWIEYNPAGWMQYGEIDGGKTAFTDGFLFSARMTAKGNKQSLSVCECTIWHQSHISNRRNYIYIFPYIHGYARARKKEKTLLIHFAFSHLNRNPFCEMNKSTSKCEYKKYITYFKSHKQQQKRTRTITCEIWWNYRCR